MDICPFDFVVERPTKDYIITSTIKYNRPLPPLPLSSMATEHLHDPPRALPILQVFLDPTPNQGVFDVTKAILKSFDGRTLLNYQRFTRSRFSKALKCAEQAQKGVVTLARDHKFQDHGGADAVHCREWLSKMDRYTEDPYSRGGVPMSYRDFAQAWDGYIQCQQQEWTSTIFVFVCILLALIIQAAYTYFTIGQGLLGSASDQIARDLYILLWYITLIGITVSILVKLALLRVHEPSKGLEAILRLVKYGPAGFLILDLVFSMPIHYILFMNFTVCMELAAKAILSSGPSLAWLSQRFPEGTPAFLHLIADACIKVTYTYPALMFAATVWCLRLSRSIQGRAALVSIIQSSI